MPGFNKPPPRRRLDFQFPRSILIASTGLVSMDRNKPIKRKIMSVRETVEAKLAEVVAKHSLMPFPNVIDDDDELDIFGLDSLAFMNLLMAIEKEVGFIPRAILEGDLYPETFGDLVSAYDTQENK